MAWARLVTCLGYSVSLFLSPIAPSLPLPPPPPTLAANYVSVASKITPEPAHVSHPLPPPGPTSSSFICFPQLSRSRRSPVRNWLRALPLPTALPHPSHLPSPSSLPLVLSSSHRSLSAPLTAQHQDRGGGHSTGALRLPRCARVAHARPSVPGRGSGLCEGQNC